ncbi:hypothetical protein NDU88_007004 [Pleurodeles waltl]|uniref:Uncharacterized protein n=1 Tax=Pleurodeles waltl TaxID=8319 RepID=A0AAV7N332_PLEWA|nr:hypothetical protein NDU88_007004 [Pleurodeles waltl]
MIGRQAGMGASVQENTKPSVPHCTRRLVVVFQHLAPPRGSRGAAGARLAARAPGRWQMVADAGLTRASQKLRRSDGPPAVAVAGDAGSIAGWELRGSSVRGLVWGSRLRERGKRSWQLSTPRSTKCQRLPTSSTQQHCLARHGSAAPPCLALRLCVGQTYEMPQEIP